MHYRCVFLLYLTFKYTSAKPRFLISLLGIIPFGFSAITVKLMLTVSLFFPSEWTIREKDCVFLLKGEIAIQALLITGSFHPNMGLLFDRLQFSLIFYGPKFRLM